MQNSAKLCILSGLKADGYQDFSPKMAIREGDNPAMPMQLKIEKPLRRTNHRCKPISVTYNRSNDTLTGLNDRSIHQIVHLKH